MSEPDLHGRPSASELLEAAREFLADELVPSLEGRAQFHARVTDNVLGIVARELELGGAQRRSHARRLAALGYDDDAALAAAIRAGDLDERYDEVSAALRAAVADKLAVANPDYPEPED